MLVMTNMACAFLFGRYYSLQNRQGGPKMGGIGFVRFIEAGYQRELAS